jgi:hypothetical protein
MNLGLEKSTDSNNIDFYWAEAEDFYDQRGSGYDIDPSFRRGGTLVLDPRSLLVLKSNKGRVRLNLLAIHQPNKS